MKNKSALFLIITILVSLFLLTGQVFAGPAAKPTPKAPKTPGAKATEKADERATKMAEKGKKGKPEHYRGTIDAADGASLTLKLDDGSTVTVGLTAETRIQVPGQGGGVEALQPGLKAMVQAYRDENDALVARSVHVIPGRPTRMHHVGWVTDYQPGISITIQAHDGQLYTFLLTAETRILPVERAGQLAAGSRVTIIAPRDVSATEATAKGIVVHPDGSGEGGRPGTPTVAPTP